MEGASMLLERAEKDLKAAKLILNKLDDRDLVLYLLEQTTEKTLKALLISQASLLEKLVNLAEKFGTSERFKRLHIKLKNLVKDLRNPRRYQHSFEIVVRDKFYTISNLLLSSDFSAYVLDIMENIIKELKSKREIQDVYKKVVELFKDIHEKSGKIWHAKEQNHSRPKSSKPHIDIPCLFRVVRLYADSREEVLKRLETETLREHVTKNADEILELLENLLSKSVIKYDRRQSKKHLQRWLNYVPDILVILLTMPVLLVMQWCLVNYYSVSRYPEPGKQIPQCEYDAIPDAIKVLEGALKAARKYVCFTNEFFKTMPCDVYTHVSHSA